MGWLWEVLRGMFCTRPNHAEGDTSKLHWPELRIQDAVSSSIKESEVHWSELPVDPTNSEILEELEIQERNRTSWKALQQLNPFFFQDWNEKVNVGQLIAEGGQAKIYEATWKDEQYSHLPEGVDLPKEMVVKVFKLEGCSLEDFSTQWPRVTSISNTVFHGQSRPLVLPRVASVSSLHNLACPTSNVASYSYFHKPDYICPIIGAYVLGEKRFAFLMQRYKCDLRSLIDSKMRDNGGHGPPLPADETYVLFCIAEGMGWLHSHGVVHRGLKSSNVLARKKENRLEYVVADFECSLSTIGTGFWRAPEVLQELRDRSGRKREDICTMKSDVYSFGMLCFEVWTGGFPFPEFSTKKDWDEIIDRDQRPVFPDYVDSKLQHMVKRCWDRDPRKRPSFRYLNRKLKRYEKERR